MLLQRKKSHIEKRELHQLTSFYCVQNERKGSFRKLNKWLVLRVSFLLVTQFNGVLYSTYKSPSSVGVWKSFKWALASRCKTQSLSVRKKGGNELAGWRHQWDNRSIRERRMHDEQSEFGDATLAMVSSLLFLSMTMIRLQNNHKLTLSVKRLFVYSGGPTQGVSQHRI